MDKLIFLDVDGVLNSTKTAHMYFDMFDRNGYGGFWNDDTDKPTYENVLGGQELVDNLRRIVEETDAKIVVSSTWRITHRWYNFGRMFAVYGWLDAPVIGATDRAGPIRGFEIQRFLETWGPASYVILDDSTDMLPSQLANFVNTDEAVGLTSDDADKAIAILNGGIMKHKTYPLVTPGVYWYCPDESDKWDLVCVQDESYRPDGWFEPGQPKVGVYPMAWDCTTYVNKGDQFVLAILITPNGRVWEKV